MLYVWSSQQCSLCIQLKITYHLRHCLILLKKWTYFHYITMVQETSFNLLDMELCWELFSTTHCFSSVAYIKPCSVQNSRWISDMCNFTILYWNKFIYLSVPSRRFDRNIQYASPPALTDIQFKLCIPIWVSVQKFTQDNNWQVINTACRKFPNRNILGLCTDNTV